MPVAPPARQDISHRSLMRIVLGSRSPRRLELLRLLLPADCITVCPPQNADEAGFDDLSTLPEFEQRILEITQAKADDVLQQLDPATLIDDVFVLVADTTVVVTDPAGRAISLGQPPLSADWPQTVRAWFRDYFAGQAHVVLSGVSVIRVSARDGQRLVRQRVCRTSVTMRSDVERWLAWYLSTDEPLGKAGGYAIQGAASLFVTKVEGSYSNVVGLPLEETFEMLRELGAV